MTQTQNIYDQGGTVEFASSEPRHYDRVPSIIDHLTYIEESVDEKTGETIYTRRRLTPIDKELYRILRYRAGNGACWRNTEDLAEHVGCGKNAITESKKALGMPFEQLDGNQLINLQEKMTRTIRGEKCVNRKPVHCITITNIWRYNNAFMDALTEAGKKRRIQQIINDQREQDGDELIQLDPQIEFPKRKQVISMKEAEIAIERMGQPGRVEIVHNPWAHHEKGMSRQAHHEKGISSLEGSSLIRDVNKDNRNKDHCLKTDPKANALARCLLTTSNVEECFASEATSCDWLQRFGLKASTARKLMTTYTVDELLLAALYVKGVIERKESAGKKVGSLTGYYLTTLEKRWYLPKPI